MKRRTRKRGDAAGFVVVFVVVVINFFSWNAAFILICVCCRIFILSTVLLNRFLVEQHAMMTKALKMATDLISFCTTKMSFLFIYVYYGYEKEISIRMCIIVHTHSLCEPFPHTRLGSDSLRNGVAHMFICL